MSLSGWGLFDAGRLSESVIREPECSVNHEHAIMSQGTMACVDIGFIPLFTRIQLFLVFKCDVICAFCYAKAG